MDWMNRGFRPEGEGLEALGDALRRLRELDAQIDNANKRIEQIKYDLKFLDILNDNEMTEWEPEDDE